MGESFIEIDNMRVESDPNRTRDDVDLWATRFDEGNVYLIDQDKLFILDENDEFAIKDTVSVNFSTSAIEKIQLNGSVKNDTTYLYVMYRLDNTTRFVASQDGGETWSAPENARRLNNSARNSIIGLTENGDLLLYGHYENGRPIKTQGIAVSAFKSGNFTRPKNVIVPYFKNT